MFVIIKYLIKTKVWMAAISAWGIILPNPIAAPGPVFSIIYNIQIMSDSSNLDADRPKLANFRAT